MVKFESIIQTEKLTKTYGSHRGILDMDLKVRRGEIFGLLGLPGAGKTTTARLLVDLIRPTQGTISLWGKDIRRHGVELRRRIGYLPGHSVVDPQMTGEQWLRYLSRLRGGITWKTIQQLAARLECDLTGIPPANASEPPQKLNLIQALMHKPELLILDEPTRCLPPPTQEELHRLLAEIRAEGRTVLLTTRNLLEIERACDRVGILQEGVLKAVEDVSDFRQKIIHRIELHFHAPVSPETFSRLPGVRETTSKGNVLYCTIQGSIDPVTRAAGQFRLLNILQHEPDLEENLSPVPFQPAPRPSTSGEQFSGKR